MQGETIIIFGGTGSLGRALIGRYIKDNTVINFSRDECKHHELRIEWGSNFVNYSCDIADCEKVRRGVLFHQPSIIIMAAAMKHIDACECDSEASINTNVLGIKNILDVVEYELSNLPQLKCVVMVSTDKACSPINTYGICKALAEKMTIERALRCSKIKWVVTRYGNVLNSRGSIIPFLHKIGTTDSATSFTLTDERMTRFVMSLDQSVDLITEAILNSPSGTITIPYLPAMLIKDLFGLFARKYNKPIVVTGRKKGEKLHEDLVNDIEGEYARTDGKNIIVFPTVNMYESSDLPKYETGRYTSNMKLMNVDELHTMLTKELLL